MSVGIQNQLTATVIEMSLFAADAEEMVQKEALDLALPDGQGELKTASKLYSLSLQHQAPHTKETSEYVHFFGPKTATKLCVTDKPSSAQMAATPRGPAPQAVKGEMQGQAYAAKMQNVAKDAPQAAPAARGMHPETSPARSLSPTRTSHHLTPAQKQTSVAKEISAHTTRHEKTEQLQKVSSPLVAHQWTKEETRQWWETRYHQREREGGHKGGHDQDQPPKEEAKRLRISKSANVSSDNHSSISTFKEEGTGKVKKPELTPPKVGIFALYYLLTKIGLLSDGASNFAYKKEVELIDLETTEIHKKRLEDIREGIKKEQETVRWGVAAKVFSWITSLIAIITGIALIATGVGAVGGAMLIAGGTLQIANQVMELAGGWKKVAEMLPGDDSEKKRAVISWMQIGIAVLCIVLSGAGVIWGGTANFLESMQTAMGFLSGMAIMGHGVTTIGEGIAGFMFKDKLADIKKFDIQLARLKHMRQDLMDKVEWGVDRLEKLFEDLAQALEFERELFQADQMLYR
jgi:hypothetical protein